MGLGIRDSDKSSLANRSSERSWERTNKPADPPAAGTQTGGTKDKVKDNVKNAPVTLADGKKNLVTAGDTEHHVGGVGPGGVKTDAYVQGPSFKMDAGAKASISTKGFDVDVNLKVDANAVKAGASVEKEIHLKVQGEDVAVKVKLGADAQVGANGELKIKLHIGPNGVSADLGAEGFAGAKGSLKGSIEVDGNGKKLASAELGVTLAAGVAGGAKFEAGLDHFKASAYLVAGVGVGMDVKGSVDYGNIAGFLPQLVEPSDLLNNAKDLGGAALDLGGKAVNAVKHIDLNPFN